MRTYNKWNLELKWWLEENGIGTDKLKIVRDIAIGFVLAGLSVLSFIYFNRGIK